MIEALKCWVVLLLFLSLAMFLCDGREVVKFVLDFGLNCGLVGGLDVGLYFGMNFVLNFCTASNSS